jgi:hypothetical protein
MRRAAGIVHIVSIRKRVIAIGVAVVASAAGLAYSMAPSSSRAADSAWLAGVSGIHEAVGRQQYDTSARKQAIVQCKAGEVAISGGWILAGDFQHAAPANTPTLRRAAPRTEATSAAAACRDSGRSSRSHPPVFPARGA